MNLADKIVTRPVASLVPYASNARTHTPAQIDLIARSISAFGFTNPILVDGEKGIIAGHARFQAAQKLLVERMPNEGIYEWTRRQAVAVANKTAEPSKLSYAIGSVEHMMEIQKAGRS